MKEGLYRATFSTLTGGGWGMAYLSDGKIYGGDSVIYYVGNYQLDGDQFGARVRVDRHSDGVESVFGRDQNILEIEGVVSGDMIEAEARSKQASGIGMKITMQWLAS